MEKYKRNLPIDYTEYEKENGPLKAMYGLPEEVRFCKKCLVSNQRPNSEIEHEHTSETKKKTIYFHEDGVCDACKFAEQKQEIDWQEREKELVELCDRFRRSDGGYDCLVPGSGGKDSHYAAYLMKYKYNMTPLLWTFPPHLYTPWGWNNLQSWINGGADHVMYTPMTRVYRLLTRLSVENLFHPELPFICGLKNMALKVALTHQTPLVIYGENEAEYGNPIAENQTSLRYSMYHSTQDESKIALAGTPLADLKEYFGLKDVDLKMFMPVSLDELGESKVEVHLLGYYLKWHLQDSYIFASEQGNFQPSPERTPGTHTKHCGVDDKMDDLHFYTYFTKFGMGRTTEDASHQIRSGDITREEGVALVKRYDGEFPARFSKELFRYMSIDPKEYPVASEMFEQPTMDLDYFMHLADRFRSPHIWKYSRGKWELRHKLWEC